jgi:threonine aldolase
VHKLTIAIMGSIAQNLEPIFTPQMSAKVKAAQDKASRDFRSDVVTVPTEQMMQVC